MSKQLLRLNFFEYIHRYLFATPKVAGTIPITKVAGTIPITKVAGTIPITKVAGTI